MPDDMPTADCLTLADMLAAHERIEPQINRTPVLRSDYLDDLTGAQLFFKCENLQEARAFKLRGACNAVFGLNDETAERGVCTHSSGNHALNLSYAAGRRGIPCNVVMLRTAPQTKKGAVRRYGGIITECEPSTTSARRCLSRFRRARGRIRAPLQRPARDRWSGHLLGITAGTDRRPGRGGRPHRRRRHDLGHLPGPVEPGA